MKWTTANVNNPNYLQNHEIYVGTQTGSFKKLSPTNTDNPFLQKNLYDLSKVNKDSKITALAFGNEEQTEILIGRADKTVQLQSLNDVGVQTSIEVMSSPVVGLARFGEYLVSGFGSGQVHKMVVKSYGEQPLVLLAGDNMTHMRQCPQNRKLVATGGKDRQNNLKIFDIEEGKQVFTSKNLPNDFLQLEVPVWDSDVGFIDANTPVTCSRNGYVRVYDIRKQRRPVKAYVDTDSQTSFATLVARDNYIYTGTTMGALKAFDIRYMKNIVHTYKGFTGSISDLHIDSTGKYLASASLDRYVRVHHVDSCVMQYQCYVKSKATRVLIRESVGNPSVAKDVARTMGEDEDEEQEEIQDKVALGSADEEYDDIFDNLPTVCENDDTEEVSNKNKSSKRKIIKNKVIETKKKKTRLNLKHE